VQSQKALSLQWIEKNIPHCALHTRLYEIQNDVKEAMIYRDLPEFPAYIRSCPTLPQHGVMQSLRVDTPEEYVMGLRCLLLQMQAYQEENSVIAIQPFCDAIANIVWGPGIMSIGPGHDGVTAGKSPVITVNAPAPSFYEQAIRDLNLPEVEIEMLVDRNCKVWVSQVRYAPGHFSIGTPPVSAIPGFLHKTHLNLSASRIIKVNTLMDIEQLCYVGKSYPTEDVIVSHPYGSILSHAAAWCREKGYSYAVTDLSAFMMDEGFYHGGRDIWLHEPAKGWLLSSEKQDQGYDVSNTPIDDFRGTYFRGVEWALEGCGMEEIRQRWKTIIAFEQYAQGQVMTREIAGLAGVFTGTLLRTVVALNVDVMRCMFGGREDRSVVLKPDVAYGLDVNQYRIDDVIDILLSINGAKEHHTPQDSVLSRWKQSLMMAAALKSAFELRDRNRTVSAADTLLMCVRDMDWAFSDAFGTDLLASSRLDPAKDWEQVAQTWAVCLSILRKMQKEAQPTRLSIGQAATLSNWHRKKESHLFSSI